MIIDTSVMVSAFERRDKHAIQAVRQLGQTSIRSTIVEGELTAGVEQAHLARLRRDDIEMRITTADAYTKLSRTPGHPAPGVLASHYGYITAVCATTTLKAGQNDRWILAEALSHTTTVVTADIAMHQLGTEITQRMGLSKPLTELINQQPPPD